MSALEARLVAIDQALLATVLGRPVSSPAPRREPRPRTRVRFRPIEHGADAPVRLRLTATAPEVERVVIQNWNPHASFVPVGEVEVELDPGQTLTLWMNRASPPPAPRRGEGGGEDFNSSLFILSEEQLLPI